MRIAALIFAISIACSAHAAISSGDYAKYFDMSYKNPAPKSDEAFVLPQYRHTYTSKIDFARLEHEKPLDKEFLSRLSAQDILGLDQEMADQLYARLTAGPIPDGVYEGTAKVMDGSGLKNVLKTFMREERPGWLDRFHLNPLTSDNAAKLLDMLANTLWSGKHFYKSEKVLRNVIPENNTAAETLSFMVKGFNPKSLKLAPVAIGGKIVNAWELFPAKVYCGQSLIDSRRESIIVDYAYGDRVAGYNDSIDFLATRQAFYIRDEIRMVHPGLYLGKAYLNRMTFLTFVLHNSQAEKQASQAQECWTGTQKASAL